jgi:hypothetical protein
LQAGNESGELPLGQLASRSVRASVIDTRVVETRNGRSMRARVPPQDPSQQPLLKSHRDGSNAFSL